ncbi:hypothetical protein AAFF_G00227320 [Aldrovandia affinis]|uniref:C-type lectin domain-containing protein n=1 Tax=Aldrovandia affinis TaxID=143900 RepID=A0AAD7TBH7_9TELE|nr:hypothetical protein AAFF_G00227320 [Aldrovandia affinis]
MEKITFTFLLVAGLCRVTSQGLLKQHIFVGTPKTWTEAQKYCRQTYTDLSSVLEDRALVSNTADDPERLTWIGLYRQRQDNQEWKWSAGRTGGLRLW